MAEVVSGGADGNLSRAALLRGLVLGMDRRLQVGVAMGDRLQGGGRFIYWHYVGYHTMSVLDRDGLIVYVTVR